MAGFKAIYDGRATVQGGRDGGGRTDDGRLEVGFTKPDALGGDGGDGTNPEQLFALGWAACFEGAISSVAGDDDVSDVSIDATVSIGKGQGGLGLAARLDVTLPTQDDDAAVGLVAKAHEVCPYSRATRDNIPVVITANGRPVTG